MLLLMHFVFAKAAEVWMISGTTKKRQSHPMHFISQNLLQDVKENLLSFYALTGSVNMEKKKHWKTFTVGQGNWS